MTYLSRTVGQSSIRGLDLVNFSSKVCGVEDTAAQLAWMARLAVFSGTSISNWPSVTVTALPPAVTVTWP